MKRITVLWSLFGFLALLVAPARAQLYGNDMPAYSHGRVPGMDPLAQQSFDGRRFDSTVGEGASCRNGNAEGVRTISSPLPNVSWTLISAVVLTARDSSHAATGSGREFS
jgi:hypothetical protein